MRELGEHSDALHAGLAQPVLDAGVDLLILVGDDMRPLAEQVVGKVDLDLVADVDEATELLLRSIRAGDAVLVKASNSVGLARVVERVAGGAA
jgi:UDP-N-acetylmuramoyl-tripeptide--D-alanyl-D-alanine ligase